MGGRKELSIADLAFFCEIVQLLLIKSFQFFKDNRMAKITGWMKRVYRIKEIKEVHNQFNKVLRKQNQEGYEWLNQEARL